MKPFRRRDAVLGFLAILPLPLWESHFIDRALRDGLGYLNYNKSPLLFVDVTILTLLLAVSSWFEKRTFTSGVWWFKKDENTQLLPGGRRAYLWSSALSVAVSLLAMGLCLWVGQRWAVALPWAKGAALWLGFRTLFSGREERKRAAPAGRPVLLSPACDAVGAHSMRPLSDFAVFCLRCRRGGSLTRPLLFHAEGFAPRGETLSVE